MDSVGVAIRKGRVLRQIKSYNRKSLRPTKKKQVVSIVKRQLGKQIEHCNAFSAIGAVVVPTIMTIGTNCIDLTALYCSLTPGNLTKGRAGTRVNNKSIRLRIELNANTGNTHQVVRICCFKWKPTTTTYLPTEGLILAIPNASVTGNNACSFPAYNLESQYQMLYDQRRTVVPSSDKSYQIVNIHLYGKHLPKQSQFDNPASDTGTNHVYLWVVGDTPATNQPTWRYNIQYVWTDA